MEIDLESALKGLAALGHGQLHEVGFAGPNGPGRELRKLLGLPSNTSKYFGFKLNVSLATGASKLSLFGKVPDWQRSSVRSTAELLDRFGVGESENKSLKCTLSVDKPNSYGLYLKVDSTARVLTSRWTGSPDEELCHWDIDKLYDAFQRKFQNLLEVTVSIRNSGARKFMILQEVRVLQDPTEVDFAKALKVGYLTVDNLIGMKGGHAHEHGPLFRIEKTRFHNLFPGHRSVDLTK